MNIVYCTDIVYELSGVDVTTITKANALAEIPGNRVWIVVSGNPKSLMHRLKKVSVIEVNVRYYTRDSNGPLAALWDIYRKRKIHKRKLESLLENVNPDVVIASGVLMKFFLPSLKLPSRPIFIRELHSNRDYSIQAATSWRNKMIPWIGYIYDYYWKIREYDIIVVLTENEKYGWWKYWKKVVVIPNPITHWCGRVSDGKAKVAITGGRLAQMKNFSGLVNIWAKVCQRHPEWILQIWGVGEKRDELEHQIKAMGLSEKVLLMGYTDEMGVEMSKTSLFVFSSLSESFSLVTLEAMSVGIPSVVYNCPGGIRYVIKDGVTGFLVPLNDEYTFVEKVCSLIENEELRKTMGQAALRESEQYGIEKITQRWMLLFQELLAKKRNKQIRNNYG